MTQEEKAKAYDEALEIARQIHNGNPSSGTAIVVCEQIFPQLRESEDERMVRKIESFLSAYGSDYFSNDEWREIEVWLERKKIPSVSFNPALGFDPGSAVVYHNDEGEDERIRKKIIEHLEMIKMGCVICTIDTSEEIAWLEKQKEQKPSFCIYWHKIKKGERLPCRAYVWNPDYEKHHDCFEGRLIANLENISVGGDTWYLPADDVRNLPREGVDELPEEQKPELVQHPPITYTYPSDASRDERLKAALLALLNSDLLKVKEGGYFTKQDLIDWVEKQKPAGWNDEDEEMLEYVTDCVYEFYPDPVMKYKLKDWLTQRLKSLRPCPSWKPSEEQMEALRTAVNKLAKTDVSDSVRLSIMYDNLKKL